MPKNPIIKIFFILSTLILFSQTNIAQVINDPLTNGSTTGTQIGGSFTSEGYKPGTGSNHILYTVPSQVVNGYVEFEMKGFTHSGIIGSSNDHAFLTMFDGRGIGNTPSWNNYRDNYFRWNFHWRQNASVFKCVVNCAAPTTQRLNSNFAVFIEDMNGDGVVNIDDRDWYDEPSGQGFSWDGSKSTWYKVKVEWNNKSFKAYVNNTLVWENHKSAPYDYAPIDHKIWLGSGIGKYDSDNPDVVYRNFKLVSLGGSSNYLTVSPSSQNVTSTSGSTSFSISSNVSWSATDDAAWLSVSPTSGDGNATLSANYDANSSSSSRTANISIVGGGITRTVTVIQEGQTTSNYLTVSPSSQDVTSTAGSTSFTVSSDLSWSVSDDSDWLSVSPNNGNGNATLSANYDENTTTTSRTGTITISGGGITKTVTVNQEGQTVPPFISVTPANQNVSNSAGSVNFTIESNISWTTRDDVKWLSKSIKDSSGNATLTATYEKNDLGTPRTATITVSGSGITKDVTVTQAASPVVLEISPSSQSVTNLEDSVTFVISANVEWSLTKDADWITLSQNFGTGSTDLIVYVNENTSGISRTAKITLTDGNITSDVTITQSAAPIHTILAVVSPAEGGNISGTGDFVHNSSVTITCTPNIGWKFNSWSEDGLIVSTDSSFTFVVTKSRNLTAQLSEISTDVIRSNETPTSYNLFNNFPNPFNPTTNIKFSIPENGFVNLTVYNLLGEKVATLVNNYKSSGTYSIEFNATNLPSGTYIYTINSNNYIQSKKLILLK